MKGDNEMAEIEKKRVKKEFKLISGLTDEEIEEQTGLIDLAMDYVKSNIKQNVDIKKNENILSMLIASIAYHKYVLIKESSQTETSVRLGDVSVSTNGKTAVDAANNLKNEMISLASHLLLSPNFIFRQV